MSANNFMEDRNNDNTMVNNQTGGGFDNRENRQGGNNNNMVNNQTGRELSKILAASQKTVNLLYNIEEKIEDLNVNFSDFSFLKPIEKKINMILIQLERQDKPSPE